MTHGHSAPFPFRIELNGVIYQGVFVLIDDRLITVTAAGLKRTEELGTMPPRALAEFLAGEMVREQLLKAAASAAARPRSSTADPSVPPKGWLGKQLLRLVGVEPTPPRA